MTTRAVLCSALVAGLLAFIRPAHAADDPAKTAAKAKLEEGARLLDGGDYAQALERFEEAHRLVPSPKIFFNIGLAQVGLARNPDALRAFERFVAEAKDAAANNVAEARAQIDALLPKVAIVDIQCGEVGREIVIDGRAYGGTPLAAPVYLDPGRHQLVARGGAGTTPVIQDFEASGGKRAAVTVLLPVAAPAATAAATVVAAQSPSEKDEPRPLLRNPWLWAGVGAVVAAGVLTFLLLGSSTSYPDPTLGRYAGD